MARGCLWFGGGAVVVGALGLIVVASLVMRGCTSGDEPYTVQVVSVTDKEICLKVVDGVPVLVGDGCESRVMIEDLPASITVGQCIILQFRHPQTHFRQLTTCPN